MYRENAASAIKWVTTVCFFGWHNYILLSHFLKPKVKVMHISTEDTSSMVTDWQNYNTTIKYELFWTLYQFAYSHFFTLALSKGCILSVKREYMTLIHFKGKLEISVWALIVTKLECSFMPVRSPDVATILGDSRSLNCPLYLVGYSAQQYYSSLKWPLC